MHSLGILLSQLRTSPLFHVWFCCFSTWIQISQEAGKVVWYSHRLKNFPVFCDPHSQRLQHSRWSRSRFFIWNPLGFPMSQWILGVWSLVPLPFLKPAWASGSSRFTYCWSLTWRILSITLLACPQSNPIQVGHGREVWQNVVHWRREWQTTSVFLL